MGGNELGTPERGKNANKIVPCPLILTHSPEHPVLFRFNLEFAIGLYWNIFHEWIRMNHFKVCKKIPFVLLVPYIFVCCMCIFFYYCLRIIPNLRPSYRPFFIKLQASAYPSISIYVYIRNSDICKEKYKSL